MHTDKVESFWLGYSWHTGFCVMYTKFQGNWIIIKEVVYVCMYVTRFWPDSGHDSDRSPVTGQGLKKLCMFVCIWYVTRFWPDSDWWPDSGHDQILTGDQLGQSVGRSVSWSVRIRSLVGQLVSQLVGRSVSWSVRIRSLVGQLVGQLVSRSVGQLVGQNPVTGFSTDQPTNQPTNRPTDRPTDRLTDRPTDQPVRIWSPVVVYTCHLLAPFNNVTSSSSASSSHFSFLLLGSCSLCIWGYAPFVSSHFIGQ